MDLNSKYLKEKGGEVFVSPEEIGPWCYSNEYVYWLQEQVQSLTKAKQEIQGHQPTDKLDTSDPPGVYGS